MTPKEVERLIAAGETLDVEFKGDPRADLSDSAVIEAAVCLANRPSTEPGYLLLGVGDDGSITGLGPRHGEPPDSQRFCALIANRTRPSLACQAELLSLDGRSVVVIVVPPSTSPVATSDGKYLRRVLDLNGRPECLPMFLQDMLSRQADLRHIDPSLMTLPGARWSDLDPLEFERFRRCVRQSGQQGDASLQHLPDIEIAKALGAIDANGEVHDVRLLGLLLFGKESALRRLVPTHEAAFQVLSGTRVEVNDFFRWPLLRLMEELLGRFEARRHEQEVMIGLIRSVVPNFSGRAFREATANAFVHRDYTRLGTVHVQWHADRIEVASPGGFPAGVRLDNILITPPRPRNPALADAFKRAGLVERTGRGIDLIFSEQLRSGHPAPTYAHSSPDLVKVSMPGGDADIEFVKLVQECERLDALFGLDEMLVLHELRRMRRLTLEETAPLLQKSLNEARRVMERLVESGLIEAKGNTRSRVYHLAAASYRRLGEPAAYVRQVGFPSAQQEEMIVQYARKHGSITRAEAASLCRIEPHAASRLLRRLAAGGRLVSEGERRGRRYRPRE